MTSPPPPMVTTGDYSPMVTIDARVTTGDYSPMVTTGDYSPMVTIDARDVQRWSG